MMIPRFSLTLPMMSIKPARLFWAFALAHVLLWTAVPLLVAPNLPLDVAEGYLWGREWLIGTYKHPPMQAWLLEIVSLITGRAPWGHYLLSQIAILISFWAVWQTGRRITGEVPALVGVMMLEGIIYYNFTSPEFNPNVLQLPFWALAGWSFYRGVKDNRLSDWALLGLWAAGGLYSKYSTALFLFALSIVLFGHAEGRRRLRSLGPWLALGIAVLLFMPHLWWLKQSNFLPLAYVQGRFSQCHHDLPPGMASILLLCGQLLALLLFIVLALVFYDKRTAANDNRPSSFDRFFLTTVCFAPLAVSFLVSLLLGYRMRDMWQTPFWNFIGLWVMAIYRPAMTPEALRRFAYVWLLIFFAALGIYGGGQILYPVFKEKAQRPQFPGAQISTLAVDAWHARYHTSLDYVIGDNWAAGNVAWYAPERPHVLIEGDTTISPWIDMKDLKRKGGVIVWCITCNGKKIQTMPDYVHDRFPQAEIQPPLTAPFQTYAPLPPAQVGWAILPPGS